METIIISLGGSLIIPDEIDINFLKDFKKLILSQIEKPARNADGIASAGGGKKFVIITGGGKLCRRYNKAAEEISKSSNDDLDWLGIFSTRFNAEFVKILFGDLAEDKIILDPTLSIKLNKSVIIGGGWKPGNSTDFCAVLMAKNVGAKKIINLSNTDYVYDSDPKVNSNAKKIEKISWPEYRTIIPKEWNPGLNSPFDPVASEMA
ncbi:MAG: UMP kinase, partial [Patescibacteria group bacterium]